MSLVRHYSTVHTVLKELQDEAVNPGSLLNSRGASRKQELMLLMKNLEEALKELDKIVTKYQGLTKRERRIWNQLRLAAEDLDTVRSKLTFHVTAINTFTSSLSRGTLVQIETALIELISEVRQGRRQPSLASLHDENNDSVWRELESELTEDGISSTDIIKHKAAIKFFVHNLLTDSTADTTSFVEVASLMTSGNHDPDSESVSQSPITFEDAWKFVMQVKTRFVLQPKTYRQFLDILTSYQEELLDLSGVVDWLCALLFSAPELLQTFNIFCNGFRVECGTVDNRYAFRVIRPFTAFVRIPDLQALESPTVEGRYRHSGQLKWIDPASLDILRRYPEMAVPLDWARDQPTSRASGVIEARKMLRRRFKALLARLKATKGAASNRSQSDEMNGTIQVRNRPGVACLHDALLDS